MSKLRGFLFAAALLTILLTTKAMGQDWSHAYTDTYINYITWDGAKWSVKANGSNFVIAPLGDWKKAYTDTFIN